MSDATEIRRIVLVGPTNVGKSTLFNRLTRTRAAIVCDRPGVTVDRHELTLKESPIGAVQITDTGGVGPSLEGHPLGREIERAASAAVRDADLILFVVDGTREAGLEEVEVAAWLRRQKGIDNTAIWVVANKSDANKFEPSTYHSLGFERLLGVSAEHDLGVGDLWEELGQNFGVVAQALSPKRKGSRRIAEARRASEAKEAGIEEAPSEEEQAPRIVVLGRPNVGKSTLLNAIIGDERHVVSEMPGTTRDVIESTYRRHGMLWRLSDTAGMRRPGRLERDVEWVARQKLEDAAKQADVAILMVDASEGVTDLDAAIAGMAVDFGLSVVIALNKWDCMKGDKAEDLVAKLERTKDLKMDFLHWVPVVRISALTGKGLPDLLKALDRVITARRERVQTSKLNQLFERKLKHHVHPLGPGGKVARFYYLSQVGVNPPEFILFSNLPANAIHFSYRRYITNSLRDAFGFDGTPLKLHFKTAHARR